MQKKYQRRIDNKVLLIALIRSVASKILSTIRTTPLAVMLIAGIVFLKMESLPVNLWFAIPVISYMVLIFGMAITSCFSRTRFFFVLLVLFLSQFGMDIHIFENLDQMITQQMVYTSISLFLPFDFLMFSSLTERAILSAWGKRHLLLILLQAVFVEIIILLGDNEVFHKIGMSENNNILSVIPLTPIPDVAVVVFIASTIFLLAKRRRTTMHFKMTILAVLVDTVFAQHFYKIPIAVPLFYGTSGLIIILSVIQDYYFKAYLDELTGLPSRRALNEEIMKLDGVYVVAMLDVDFFKHFNDTYGHGAGDDVLRLIASIMRECTEGKCFRYGGEEFTILFPNKRVDEVAPYLEKLREKIAHAQFVVRGAKGDRQKGGRKLHVTVSIGIAESTHQSTAYQDVMKAADIALYRAKDQGRNCVSM